MRRRRLLVLFSAVLPLLSACGSDKQGGPGKVRWDRQVCERCAMALSDWRFAAQVRSGEDPGKLFRFDDIGCAVIWLDKQSWKNHPDTEIWVNDSRSGDWIDAKLAWYLEGAHSPMGFNLSAQPMSADGALDFENAVKRVWEVETRDHIHGGGLDHSTVPE